MLAIPSLEHAGGYGRFFRSTLGHSESSIVEVRIMRDRLILALAQLIFPVWHNTLLTFKATLLGSRHRMAIWCIADFCFGRCVDDN